MLWRRTCTRITIAIRGQPKPRFIAFSSKNQRDDLSIFRRANQIKSYRIALSRDPLGAKKEEGNMKTPEGIYKINGRNPQSSFHLALHISCPSDEDEQRAAAARRFPPGFDIMIHGIRNGRGWIAAFQRWKHCTAGWIAVTDEEMRNCGGLHPTARQSRFVR